MTAPSLRVFAASRETTDSAAPEGAADRATLDLQMFAAEPEAMRAWLARAAPRAQAKYAGGPDLPRGAPGVALAREWGERGLVQLNRRRNPMDARLFEFLMIRTDEPLARAPVHAVARPELTALLRLLRHCAASGQACPSNRELARELGLKDRHAARYLVNRLAAEGKIAIEDRGPRLARVVTIRASGKETRR